MKTDEEIPVGLAEAELDKLTEDWENPKELPSVNIADLYQELSELFANYQSLNSKIKSIQLQMVKHDSHCQAYEDLAIERKKLMNELVLTATKYNSNHKAYGHPFVTQSTLPEKALAILPLALEVTPNL